MFCHLFLSSVKKLSYWVNAVLDPQNKQFLGYIQSNYSEWKESHFYSLLFRQVAVTIHTKNHWNSHTFSFPSAMLRSYVATTTLQKGGRKWKGVEFYKVFVWDCSMHLLKSHFNLPEMFFWCAGLITVLPWLKSPINLQIICFRASKEQNSLA